jgi:hypothetical protein
MRLPNCATEQVEILGLENEVLTNCPEQQQSPVPMLFAAPYGDPGMICVALFTTKLARLRITLSRRLPQKGLPISGARSPMRS